MVQSEGAYTLEQILQPGPDYNALMKGIDVVRQKPKLATDDVCFLESAMEQLCTKDAPYFSDPALRLRAFKDLQCLIATTHRSANSDSHVMAIFLALRIRELYYRDGQPEEGRKYTDKAYEIAVDFFMKESEDGTYPAIDMLLGRIESIKHRYPKFGLIAVESGPGNDRDWIEGAGGPLPEAQMRNLRIEPAS